jgi:hypothetical protein
MGGETWRNGLNSPRKLLILSLFVIALSPLTFAASAAKIYITPNGTAQGACTTSPQTPAWFNNSANWGSGSGQIGPGTTVTLCGTFTGTANSTEFSFQGSGTSGNPITLLFDTGTQLSAPYWAASSGGNGCGGAICMYNRSYITVNGGSNGIIQNTANGDGLANQQDSEGIEATACNNCTIENLTIQNIYVHPANGTGSIDQTQMRCISISGSNWQINNNTMHDVGWCLFQAYNNHDTNVNIYDNNIYNFDHGWMLATSSGNSFSNAFFHDNQVHDSANWDASGCPFHHDGIHTFGTNGSSMTGVYVYNNYFYGNWGVCPTGFIFVEGGASSTPSHMQSSAWFNNVAIVNTASPIVNTNGWIDIASGESGTQQVFANTVIGPNNSDNTLCLGMQNLSGLSFEDNTISNCGDPVGISSSSLVAVDYNFYGTTCGSGGNCFIWNGSFTGSFSAWKAACACDSHAVHNTNPLLNSDGSPQSGSPVIQQGADLSSLANGNFASLANDTSKGNTRTPLARPTGSCSTQGSASCWDIGAYQYAASNLPAPPTGLAAVVQ